MFYNDDTIYKMLYPFNNLPGAEDYCYKILTYLLDLPREDHVPSDDGPRADLIRLLWYDEPDALSRTTHSLPTADEKLSLIYRPEIPNPSEKQSPQGYRLFLQQRISEAQLDQKTELRIFPSYCDPVDDYHTKQGIQFQILCGMSINPLMGGQQRAYCIALNLIRALNGVDFGGAIGVLHFSRQFYRSCTMEPFSDARYNLGYNLVMAAEFATNKGDASC